MVIINDTQRTEGKEEEDEVGGIQCQKEIQIW